MTSNAFRAGFIWLMITLTIVMFFVLTAERVAANAWIEANFSDANYHVGESQRIKQGRVQRVVSRYYVITPSFRGGKCKYF